MAGRPKKKAPDTKKSTEELVRMAALLFQHPYDDRKGKRMNMLPSIRSVAEELNTTILKTRKLLITAGYYTTEQSREVQLRFSKGQSIEQIMVAIEPISISYLTDLKK